MESSREAPLNGATTETSPVGQDGLSSCPSSSQPEKHVILQDMASKFETQPDNQDGEEEDESVEADAGQDGDLSAEEITFLEEFPVWKEKQEKYIAILRAFAEDADRAYKKFTKKKMLNKFVTVASELVSIAGLALAPATAGASLPLTVFGQSVSAVAAVGGIVTELREVSRNKNLCDRVNSRVPNRDQQFEDAFGERIPYFTAAGQVVYKCGRAWEVINKRVLALLPTKSLSYTVRKILPSSVQPLAKVAPVYGGPIAFVSLGEDVYSLWDNWRKLKNEAKAELAEELRDRAKELEEELILNTKCYDTLKKKKELRENQLTRSSLKETKKTEPQPPSGNGKAGSQGTGKMKAWASEMS